MQHTFEKPQYVTERLNQDHVKHAFCSGSSALDNYLQQLASQDIKRNISTVYVLTYADAKEVLGYYTLASTSIVREMLPPQVTKKLPSYPALPGILLGRLAVDESVQGQGVGANLLIDALKRSYQVSHVIGASFIIVDAKDGKAGFYQHYGFIPYEENKLKLYLPMKTVEKLL